MYLGPFRAIQGHPFSLDTGPNSRNMHIVIGTHIFNMVHHGLPAWMLPLAAMCSIKLPEGVEDRPSMAAEDLGKRGLVHEAMDYHPRNGTQQPPDWTIQVNNLSNFQAGAEETGKLVYDPRDHDGEISAIRMNA